MGVVPDLLSDIRLSIMIWCPSRCFGEVAAVFSDLIDPVDHTDHVECGIDKAWKSRSFA